MMGQSTSSTSRKRTHHLVFDNGTGIIETCMREAMESFPHKELHWQRLLQGNSWVSYIVVFSSSTNSISIGRDSSYVYKFISGVENST